MSGVPYPNATASPQPSPSTGLPTTDTPVVGTDAPVAATEPLAVPLPPNLAKEGSPEQQSAFESWAIKNGVDPNAKIPAGATTFAEALAAIQAAGLGASATKAVDPTVAQGQSAYEQIWGVTPPHGYIEKLVKAGFNVFQIQLHELSMPGANRTQYWRDNEAQIAQSMAKIFGRR